MIPTTIRMIPMMPAGFMKAPLNAAPAGDEINDQDDDGQDQQNVNEAPHRI
jgi:hypothetical protein